MPTASQVPAPERVPAGVRGPIAPPFAFGVLDRLLGTRQVRVLDVERLTPTVTRLVLTRPLGYRFRAGQFALLRVSTTQGPDMRPLSLAGPPDADTLEFATRTGTSAFKHAVLALEPGDDVKVSRPLGSFRYDPERPAVFVVGGLGITPVRSVLLRPDAGAAAAPVRLVFSNHGADDIPFQDELTELARRDPTVKITWVVSSPSSATPAGTVHRGHVDAVLLRQYVTELPEAAFYVSGPPSMVTGTVAELRRLGVGRGRIRKVAQGRR